MNRPCVRTIFVSLIVFSLVGGLLSGSGVATAQVVSIPTAATQPQPNIDTTVLRVTVHENTSATWTLQVRTRLKTKQDLTGYRAFQSQFENDTDRFLDPFAARINGTVDAASQATGREMDATDFAASTSIQSLPRKWGVVTYRFRWRNFSTLQDGQLVVGDVFESGLFIAENDTLEVASPPGYRIASVNPRATQRNDDIVSWDGPESFANGQPLVVFEQRESATNATITTPAATETNRSTSNWQVVGCIAAVGVLFVFVTTNAQWRNSKGSGGGFETSASVDDGTVDGTDSGHVDSSPSPIDDDGVGDAGDGNSVGDGDEHTDGDTSTGDSDAEQAEDGTEQTGSDPASKSVDQHPTWTEPSAKKQPILTDEDHVRNVVNDAGGRVRQKDIVAELEWSKSKVSRVLSRMEDDGLVKKLRLGRENIVELVSESDEES